MGKYFQVCLYVLVFQFTVSAQEKDSVNSPKKEPKIEYMGQYITLKLTQNSDIEGIAVKTPTNKIELNPNISSVTRLSVNYKFISFSLRYVPKFLTGNDDVKLRGKTKGGGFDFGFNFKHWLQHFSYTKTRGYYLENTSDYITTWKPGDPYIQFPDLLYKNFEGITAYNFNPDYSVNAVSSQSERQLKSAGSFIPHFLYRYYIIDDRTPLTGTNTSQKAKTLEFLIGAGYYHTFVLKQNFYFALGLTPAFGVNFLNLTTRFPTGYVHTKQTNTIFRLDGQAGLGYNGERFFAGVYSKLSTESYNQQKTSAVTSDARVAYQIFVGYRLKAPKFLQQNVQRAMDLIKL